MEFWPNCKYAKHPSPIFQSSTLAAAAQMYKLFASREFPRSLGLFRTIVHSHVRKRTPEWNGRNQNTCWSRQLSHRNVYGVFTSSASRLLSQPTRVKIPRSTVPFQAANFWQSGRWSQIPLSERERGSFSVWNHCWVRSIEFLNLFASPHNWRITTWDGENATLASTLSSFDIL